MAGMSETSGLLRGQQCSSRGCSQEGAGRRRIRRLCAAVYSQSYKSQFSTYRFFSLLAPARVQVGGETEGKELKGISPHPAHLSPKESAGPNPERRDSFLSSISLTTVLNAVIYFGFLKMHPPPPLSERLSEGSHLRRRIPI